MKKYPHGPTDAAMNLKLRCRVGDLDLPERRKRHTSSREEKIDARNCPCDRARESSIYTVAECELSQDKQDVLEGNARRERKCCGLVSCIGEHGTSKSNKAVDDSITDGQPVRGDRGSLFQAA